jgi:anaerobic magnesium-protoporphyrin IX monomethyl ester cyclase
MKKVLLIVLPYLQLSSESKAGYWGDKYAKKAEPSTKMKSWPAFPYGTLSVASYIKDVAHVKILDCNADDDYIVSLHWEMQGFRPDIVGFNMTFDNSYSHLPRILDVVKSIDPEVITVIGGAATFPVYREIMEDNPDIQAICYGDGEIPMRRLVLDDSPDLVPGWVTRKSLGYGIEPSKTFVPDLDDIIDIDYSLVDHTAYSMREEFSPYSQERGDRKCFFMVTSKGCPYACVFCYRSQSKDRRMRYASVDKVIAHAKTLIDNYGMNVLTICDDQFLVNMKRAKEIFRRLADLNIKVECLQGVSVGFIDEEMADLMKAAGMSRIVLPIESGSPEILKKMVGKPVELDRAKEVVRILRDRGFWVTAVFVMGFPGETEAHRLETLNWIREAGLDWSTFSAAVPIKGTRLWDICIEHGYVDKDMKLGDMDYGNYSIVVPDQPPEYIAREIYKMNLITNFVENRALKIGDHATARRVFQQVLEMVPNHAFAHYYLGNMNEYNRIIETDPKWAEYAKELIHG